MDCVICNKPIPNEFYVIDPKKDDYYACQECAYSYNKCNYNSVIVPIRTGIDQKVVGYMNYICEHCNVNKWFYTTKTGINLCSSCYALYCAAFGGDKPNMNANYTLTDAEKIEVKKQAEKEYQEEKFRKAVDQEKTAIKLRKKHWFPWRIRIERIK